MFVKLLSEQLGYWLGMTVLFGKFYDGFKASFNEGILQATMGGVKAIKNGFMTVHDNEGN